MEPRLASKVRVQAMLRLAQEAGGFGAILRKGDEVAGDLALVLLERGQGDRLYRRLPGADFTLQWVEMQSKADGAGDQAATLERLAARDPDLWIIECDVPNTERFIATLTAMG